jgi:hypothetical protein
MIKETLEKLVEIDITDCKLDNQIKFMESLGSIVKTPMTISIITSLKELRGVKQNQLQKLKDKSQSK